MCGFGEVSVERLERCQGKRYYLVSANSSQQRGGLAINCCDYDEIKHYDSGIFNAKYKTNLAGKVVEIARQEYPEQIVSSFRDGEYTTVQTLESIVLYRLFGQYRSQGMVSGLRGARLGGSFASTEFAESIIDAKLRLALDPTWFNTKMYEAQLQIPSGTTLSIGTVASVCLKTGTVLPGGADQVLLPRDWPESWIIGYRRVTSRQLLSPPCFAPQKPAEYNTKESLYRKMCPACGCEQIRKLTDAEQFSIVGQKGNQYVMQNVCLNPECQYHW